MDALLANLRAQLEEAHRNASAITQRCADENRDLNDNEQANFNAYRQSIEALQPRIEHLAEVQRSYDASSAALATVTGDGRAELLRREAPDFMTNTYRSAGEWVVDYLLSTAPAGLQQVTTEQRSAARERIQRAVANQTTADNPGLIPEPILGPLISFHDNRRPVWNSFAQRTITQGPVFYRPRVVQHVAVGEQTAQKTELASQKMTIERVSVTVKTYGGVVDVSLQDQYWTNPSIMQVIIDDLRAHYVIQTEAVAAALLNTTADANAVAITAPSSGAKIVESIYDAAAAVFGQIFQLPTHVAMSVDMWAHIGGLADTTGRPLFPPGAGINTPGGSNPQSFGTDLLGLTPVVSSALPADTLIVYRGDTFEAWEQIVGVLQVTEPRLLGTEVAYAGFAAAAALTPEGAASITGAQASA